MEVHHHSHHGKKKWTEYFWEFFMLFLAVTLGFFVENQREHLVEHQRAKVYAATLYEELQKDTARLNKLINRHGEIASDLDTLCLLLKERDRLNVTNGMLYYYANSVTKIEYFSSNNTTVEQLKGSGNLRIMGNDLSYKIGEYDKMIRELEKEYGLSKTEFAKMEELHFKIVDVYLVEKMFPPGLWEKPRDSIFRLTDLPVKKDPDLMQEYSGWLKFEANVYRFQVRRYLSPLKQSAIGLLALLKKQYHFD